jgi:hypothetical protein
MFSGLMMVIRASETSVLREPLGVTSQKTAFFIASAVKTFKSHIALTGWDL